MINYKDARRGITYKIIGIIEEDEIYEVYHGKSSAPIRRDVILHLLKNGSERRFPVKQVKGVEIKPQKALKTNIDQVVPWTSDHFTQERDKAGIG